jgi:hypothetical protein
MGQSVPYSVSPLTPNGLNSLLYPAAINRIVPQDHPYGTDVWRRIAVENETSRRKQADGRGSKWTIFLLGTSDIA